MCQQRAIKCGDQSHGHVRPQGVHIRSIQVLQHIDQTDQSSDHAKGRCRIGPPLIHGDDCLVPLGGLLDLIFQDTAHPLRVIVVHHQHDRLLKKGVFLLVPLLFQCQQPIFSGDLCQLGQLIHIHLRIKGVGVEHDLKVLWQGPDLLGIAGDHHRQRAADDDQNTGQVHKVL